jgi:hypothetical protein
VNALSLKTKPEAVLHPLEKAPREELILKGFQWIEEERPKTRLDIFK